MQTKPKLYGSKESQPVRAVLALLAIGRIDFEFVPVDLAGFETRSKKFIELNPFSHIPFLVDGELKLGESNAIMLYLCQKYTQLPRTLIGKTMAERAMVHQYLSWYQGEFRPAFFEPIMMRKRLQLTGKVGRFSAANEQFAWEQIEGTAKLLNKLLKLGGKPYLCGDHLTIADLLVYFEYTNLILYDKSYPQLKHIKAWTDKIEAIPEVAAIMKEFLPSVPIFRKSLMSIRPPQSKL